MTRKNETRAAAGEIRRRAGRAAALSHFMNISGESCSRFSCLLIQYWKKYRPVIVGDIESNFTEELDSVSRSRSTADRSNVTDYQKKKEGEK